jgi:hypothetical protein
MEGMDVGLVNNFFGQETDDGADLLPVVDGSLPVGRDVFLARRVQVTEPFDIRFLTEEVRRRRRSVVQRLGAIQVRVSKDLHAWNGRPRWYQ